MTGGATRSRSNRWTKLIILLIVVIALFIALSIYAEHLAHNRNNSAIAPAAWTALAAPPWLGNPANPRNPRNPASLAGTTTLRP
jgi:disulfide bond formation protein DsbB